MERDIARMLLEIKAVFLSPNDPFTWASGIKSPVYCDNRLILSYPEGRRKVAKALAHSVSRHYPETELVAGTSTGGIAHAALVAELLELPMVYVRASAKEHGRQQLIEGRALPGQKTVVIEDLISTGGSVTEVVNILREAKTEVLGIASIFTYEMQKGFERLRENNVKNVSLSSYSALIKTALETGLISQKDFSKLEMFQKNPNDTAWMEI